MATRRAGSLCRPATRTISCSVISGVASGHRRMRPFRRAQLLRKPSMPRSPASEAFLAIPWTRIVMVRVEGADADATRTRARKIAQRLRVTVPRGNGPKPAVEVGPDDSALSRPVGRWRFQTFSAAATSGISVPGPGGATRAPERSRSGVRVTVDVDPRNPVGPRNETPRRRSPAAPRRSVRVYWPPLRDGDFRRRRAA